jgi:CRISPR-associated protein Cst2
MNTILSVNVSTVYNLENHRVNGDGDKRQKEVSGRAYVSGQKIRFMLFEKMKDLVRVNGVQDSISCGDGKTGDISKDIVSDLGGYMITEKNSKSRTRKSPINVSFSVAKNVSEYFDDLFVRFSNFESSKDNEKQRINTQTYSVKDVFSFNYQLNCDEVGVEKYVRINDNIFLKEVQLLCIPNDEKIKRIGYFIQSINGLVGLANTSRNAVEDTPKNIFIAFDTKRKFVKYFDLTENEKVVYIDDLKKRGITYFIGDSEKKCGVSVDEVIEKSLNYIKNNTSLFSKIEFSQEALDERDKYILENKTNSTNNKKDKTESVAE